MNNRLFHPPRPYHSRPSRRTLIASLAAAPLWAGQEVIKIDVDLVNLLFSVREKNGAFVNSLTKDDIELREDGKVQELRSFTRETDLPLTIGLLVDVSVSQQRLIETERQAASQFFRQVLRSKDMAFVISFGSEAELLQDSTNAPKLLERGLSELRVNSSGGGGMVNPGPIPQSNPRGTILFDAIYLGAAEKLQSEVGRKALILITDGVDQGSRVKMEEAIRSALRADALIYSVYYVDPAFYGFGGGGGESTLRRLSEDTGGRFFRVERRTPLDVIFQQIEEEMRSQYAASYSSSNPARDGAFRRIEIRTLNKDLRVQARKGYFAPRG